MFYHLIIALIFSASAFAKDKKANSSTNQKYKSLLPSAGDLNTTKNRDPLELWEENTIDRSFDSCFDQYLEYHKKVYMSRKNQKGFTFDDDVTVFVTITPDGFVTKANSKGRTLTSPVLHRCLENHALKWQLPSQMRGNLNHSFSRRLQFEVRTR